MHRLVTNTVEPQQVRETDGAYIIEDVPIVRPMHLSGGYVPETNIRETANDWAGVPATLNHPRDNRGKPVAAETQPGTHLGTLENPTYDGDHVRGTLRINKTRLTVVGGEAQDIATALDSGHPIDVSSQYRAEDLPAGEYDGKYRSNAERIVEPDSVAILPNKDGVCSIDDGCGINPKLAANADITVPMTDDPSSGEDHGQGGEISMDANASADGIQYQGTAGGDLDESEIPSDDFESHYVFDGDSKSASSFPLVDADGNLRRGNVESAFSLRGHAPDVDKLLDVLSQVNDVFDDPPIDSEDLEDARTANAGLVSNLRSFLGLDRSTDTDESTETQTQSISTETDSDMGDKTDELVANHDFEEENLPSEDTECFDRIYEAVTSNDTETDASTGSEPEQTETTDAITFDTMADFEAKIEEVVANSRSDDRKDELASDIVSNSNEYDEIDSVREDFPTVEALETKKSAVTESQPAGVPGMGSSPHLAGNTDVEDFPSPIASERAEQLAEDD